MSKRVRVALLAVLALGVGGVAFAAADATQHQIYEAAETGHLAQAQQMIDQVLRDHPQSAKAHFIAAELDARIGDFDAARQQLAVAKQLDPSQSFASTPTLGALQRQLAGIRAVRPASGPQPYAPPARHSSLPWGLIILLALGGFILWSLFRGRAQRAYTQANGYPPGTLPSGSSGMQPGGSGLMGNLASGLAIGAGVVAGEELVRHVMDGSGSGSAVPSAGNLADPAQNQDMGGVDFGSQDSSSWGDDATSGSGDGGGWGGDGGGGGGDWS